MTRFFSVPGQPAGKARPKYTRMGRVYTPKKTKDYEKLVKACYLEQCGAEPIPEGVPVAMAITAYFDIPKSDSKKKRTMKEHGLLYPTIKADADNLAKIIMDGCNGLAYADDRQITDLIVKKRYSPYARVTVEISEITL